MYNISKECGVCYKSQGVNIANGKEIYIQFTKNEESLKTTICHELMHTYMLNDGGDTPRHKIIYDLGYKQVCYK